MLEGVWVVVTMTGVQVEASTTAIVQLVAFSKTNLHEV
jgi:hypothetical protein